MAGDTDTALVQADEDEQHRRFRDDVLSGLAQEQKTIPARYFYDLRGSELFEEITAAPEYYPTRSEIEILKTQCDAFRRDIGPGRGVVDFGAGSTAKTPLLLDCIDPVFYVPIDISGEFLRDSCEALQRRYPDMPIFPIEADFTRPVPMPSEVSGQELLGFFPGSTIGNLEPAGAVDLLRAMRSTLGDNALLLIGMDRIKDPDVLEAAYDDAGGVTAAFNRNLVTRMNRELGADIPEEAIRHRAIWNPDRARIEMHLEATREIRFEVAGERFTMREGETIHTENSHKYDERSAATLLIAGGWDPVRHYTDSGNRFMVVLAQAAPESVGP
ncbi:dimethylhistidine N-methyltransferase [Novosphingobium marinum]|uniref:Dimethylhistidine N-methyltransferase n=1 Tax=Novosphingobium marinum TaxID=1514948 RepID=A0A7Y9Y020_9SPHN|nr:L-histidine N(alpha)-methyltransferase [Novosphingobium marinum]NYH96488.1 dimethylhistidine N-methyltransferase [Novosphingobium marinum]GGC35629.1 dimethylhistidine N-methyltransferase [Novosphingobium marinum]